MLVLLPHDHDVVREPRFVHLRQCRHPRRLAHRRRAARDLVEIQAEFKISQAEFKIKKNLAAAWVERF